MAFRKDKGSDPFTQKTNRFDRFAQMSKQEEMIQQKKREIQAKLEAQKRKEAEDALKKLSASNLNKPGVKKPIGKPLNVRAIAAQIKSASNSSAPSASSSQLNIFSNDGSFMDQFRKLSGSKDAKKDVPRREEQAPSSLQEYDSRSGRERDNNEVIEDRKRERNRSRDEDNDHDQEQESRRPIMNRSRERNRDQSRDRSRDHSRDRSRDRERSRERDRNRFRDSGRPRDRDHDRPLERNMERSRENDRDIYLSRREESRWQSNAEPTRPPSPYSPAKPTDYHPPFPTMFPPPNLSLPPPNSIPSNSQPQFSQPPPQTFISYPQPPPSQPQQPALMTSASIPPPSVTSLPSSVQNASVPLQLIPQPSPIQPHSIPPPSPLDPHLIPPPPMPPTGLPPPGLLPPQFQAQLQTPMPQQPPPVLPAQPPPAISTAISHLAGIPPPQILPSFPTLPVMPVPPPATAPDGKAIEANQAPLPVPVPVPIAALPPTGVIAPVPPPSSNGSIPPLSSIKNEDIAEHSTTTSDQNDAVLHVARMVAQCGDDIEDIIKMRNRDDPNLWFLHQEDSAAYLSYRQLVEKLRRESDTANEGGDEEDNPTSSPNRRKLFSHHERATSPVHGSRDDVSYHGSQTSIKTEVNLNRIDDQNIRHGDSDDGTSSSQTARKRKRRSRWAPEDSSAKVGQIVPPGVPPVGCLPGLPPTNIPPPGYQVAAPGPTAKLSRMTRSDPALLRYAMQSFGTTNLSDEDWKKAEDHYKINLLYQDLLKKREEIKKLEMKGKHKYEYDSDEEIEGGTWEHKLRAAEMEATERWADELTRQSQGKHHIGDFLPPEELAKFMEKYSAIRDDREPDLSDYKEFKLKEDNVGFQMLQKLGWTEGQGLGADGTGMVDPVNRASTRNENQGLGIDRPDDVSKDDDEFEAYRKRMMLAYRFRPNPLNNPRRPYY